MTPVTVPANDQTPIAASVSALVTILRFHGLQAEPGEVQHILGSDPSVIDLVRYLRQRGLRAKTLASTRARLDATPLPGLAVLLDGSVVVLAKVGADKVLLVDALTQRPKLQARTEFEASWTGQLILATRRASLSDLSRRFNITWFLGAVHKYRRVLAEVLIGSFFLQLFGLVSPLFFQVVIDKVLVHRGISTLDVLVVGLVTIGIFEALLGGLRTFVFSHTTNRIDVELGARLYKHLLALPLPYFQARRVGDSIARVRELENIRQFLTSSALTLVIDLVFTFVFLAVMQPTRSRSPAWCWPPSRPTSPSA